MLRRKRLKLILLVISGLSVPLVSVLAYTIPKSTLDNSGQRIVSSNYKTVFSLGQASCIGIAQGSSYTSYYGFHCADLDNDGLTDIEEGLYATDVDNSDTDGDGLADGWEVEYSINGDLNPLDADSDDDGISDGEENPDSDPFTNLEEYLNGTDPRTANLKVEFGLGYAEDPDLFPGIAEHLGSQNFELIKEELVYWKNIEGRAAPTVNSDTGSLVHNYDWTRLDGTIISYQNAGFRNVQLVIHTGADTEFKWSNPPVYPPWIPSPLPESTAPVDEVIIEGNGYQYTGWDCYYEFMRDLVERYDGDGNYDMGYETPSDPSDDLIYPMRYFEISSEAQVVQMWQGRWLDINNYSNYREWLEAEIQQDIDDYIKFLQTSHQAALAAHPESKIILAGIGLADIHDDFPADEEIQERIDNLPSNYSTGAYKGMKFSEQTLINPESIPYFDVVEFHANSNYTGIYQDVEWLRGQMDSVNYAKPLWAGDMASATMLLDDNFRFNTPYQKEGTNLFWDIWSNDTIIEPWYRKEQAKLTAKRLS